MYYVLVALIFLLGLTIRIGNLSEISYPDGSLIFYGPDAYYQLRRLAHFLQNAPYVLNFDPLLSWPTGHSVEWPEAFVYLMGIPLKLLGVKSISGMEWGVNVLTVVVGILTMLLIYALARKIWPKERWALMALFLASFNFMLVTHSALGQYDHHGFELLMTLIIFYGVLKINEVDSPKVLNQSAVGAEVASTKLVETGCVNQARIFFFDFQSWIWGAALFLSIWISSSGLFTCSLFFLLQICLWNSQRATWRSLAIWAWASAFCLAYLLMKREYYSIVRPSLFHFSCLVVMGALSGLRFSSISTKSKWLLLAAFGGLVVAVGAWMPSLFYYPFLNAWNYVFEKAFVVSIAEVESPLKVNGEFNPNYVIANFGYLVFLIPLAFVCVLWIWISAWRNLRTKRRSSKDAQVFEKSMSFDWASCCNWASGERGVILGLAFLSIPGLMQSRFVHFITGFYLLFVVQVMRWVFRFVSRHSEKVAPYVLGLLLVLMLAPSFHLGFYPHLSDEQEFEYQVATETATLLGISNQDRLKALGAAGGAHEAEAALGLPSTGIWAPVNMGHLLRYKTGRGVITDSFYFSEQLERDQELRSAQSRERFDGIMHSLSTDCLLTPAQRIPKYEFLWSSTKIKANLYLQCLD